MFSINISGPRLISILHSRLALKTKRHIWNMRWRTVRVKNYKHHNKRERNLGTKDSEVKCESHHRANITWTNCHPNGTFSYIAGFSLSILTICTVYLIPLHMVDLGMNLFSLFASCMDFRL